VLDPYSGNQKGCQRGLLKIKREAGESLKHKKQGLRLVCIIISQSCTSIPNAVRFHQIYLVSVSGCSAHRNVMRMGSVNTYRTILHPWTWITLRIYRYWFVR